MKRMLGILFIEIIIFAASVSAGPSSTNFELRDYNFGAGGTEGSDSTNYSLFGIAGEVAQGDLNSLNYGLGGGLPNTIMAELPGAPTFTNPGDYYDRLHIIIDPSGNHSQTTFAIAITETTDTTWSNPKYVQSDNTIGTTLGLEDFQTYTSWGGASGEFITNLDQNTEYKVRVKARQGAFTESGWGSEATAATVLPYLSFGVDADSINFDLLTSVNSFTDDTQSTTFTTSTNAYHGYIIYGFATNELTNGSSTIDHYSAPNSAPTSWTGTGFGYTTDDDDLIGGTADRFTSGGPLYAGFTGTGPGDPIADTSGPIVSPITNEQYQVTYRVTADSNQRSGSYTTTVVYIIAPTF